MPAPYHGSCLCGEVAFEVTAEPIIVSCCHCWNCKKFTGTVFTTNVIFPGGAARITKGESLVSIFHDTAQDSGRALERIFCGRCASPLYNRGGDADRTLAVFYSALDDFKPGDTNPPPQVEYYPKDRAPWVHPIEGAEQLNPTPGRD